MEKKDRRKLDSKTTEGRLVGYNKKSGAYLVNMKKRETSWNERQLIGYHFWLFVTLSGELEAKYLLLLAWFRAIELMWKTFFH